MLLPPVSKRSNLGPTLVLPLQALPVLSPFVEETGFLLMMPETDTGSTEGAVTTSGLRENVGGTLTVCELGKVACSTFNLGGKMALFELSWLKDSFGLWEGWNRNELSEASLGRNLSKEVTAGTVGTLSVKGRTLGDGKPELKRFDWDCCTCWNWGDDDCVCCRGTKENCCSEVTVPSGNLVIWKSCWKVGLFRKSWKLNCWVNCGCCCCCCCCGCRCWLWGGNCWVENCCWDCWRGGFRNWLSGFRNWDGLKNVLMPLMKGWKKVPFVINSKYFYAWSKFNLQKSCIVQQKEVHIHLEMSLVEGKTDERTDIVVDEFALVFD